MGRVIDGRVHARQLRKEVGQRVAELKARGIVLRLYSMAIGENSAVGLYTRNQRRACEEVGVAYTHETLPEDIEEAELLGNIRSLNCNRDVTGIILQLPLPDHIDPQVAQTAIDPGKDVEGVSPINLGRLYSEPDVMSPCTATGVILLLDREGVQFKGAEATLIGASSIVGRPLLQMLLHRLATPTVCHIETRDLAVHSRQADILVVAAGKPGIITADMIKPGAVVIDVGINRVTKLDPDGVPLLDGSGRPVVETVGDVDFEPVLEVASAVTPVPGGVGPMTVATLLTNIVRCHEQEERRWW